MSPWVVGHDSFIHHLVDFAFPPLCLGCDDVVTGGGSICDACRKRIQHYSSPTCLTCLSPLDQPKCTYCQDGGVLLYAFGDYSGPLKELVVAYKFSGIISPSDWLATELTATFADKISLHRADALVPIPLHPGREYYRGYNQAIVFANALSDQLDIAVNIDILWRTKHRRPQSRSSLIARERNVHGVFRSDAIKDVSTIILVDDVVTTGATVLEARRELIKAGYRVPAVLAIAHGQ